MNKRELQTELEKYRPRFEEAVDLMKIHIRYLLRRRRIMDPAEIEQRVTGRVKTADRCVRKIRKIERERGHVLNSWRKVQANIHDLAGVRVVSNYLDELLVVYGYIRQHAAFLELPRMFIDYVQNPRVGYRALHTIVQIHTSFGPAKCEVQIRTALQDAWAVKSHALVYRLRKADLDRLPAEIRQLLRRQSDLLYDIDQMAGELKHLTVKYLEGRI